jgi:hypothetical protein
MAASSGSAASVSSEGQRRTSCQIRGRPCPHKTLRRHEGVSDPRQLPITLLIANQCKEPPPYTSCPTYERETHTYEHRAAPRVVVEEQGPMLGACYFLQRTVPDEELSVVL